MNTIDLEILIPASPDFIWRFLGDLSTIPQWQENVTSISFLSTQHEGQGTRWRHSTQRGRDIVVQVGAWYDTLGFEYEIVDGAPYSENRGRIKLHEVPEGTLVNWTFRYELDGLLGGIRNAMRLKRSTTNQIQDSLRNLHHLITQETGGISTHEAKASMQDAPDVDERSSYQPRHPSAFHDEAVDELETEMVLDESVTHLYPVAYDLDAEAAPVAAVGDTDTKPNPVVLSAAAPIEEQEEEAELEDTKPIELEALLAEPPSAPAPEPAPASVPAPEPPPVSAPSPAQEPAEEADVPPAPPLETVADRDRINTAQVSVFEIFGLQKPSETQGQRPLEREAFSVSDVEDARQATRSEVVERPKLAAAPPGFSEATAEDVAADSDGLAGFRRRARKRRILLRSQR